MPLLLVVEALVMGPPELHHIEQMQLLDILEIILP
jgi:hypothetical protein